jgi:pyridoxine/pyridoxamine 5'-phosphate oxidase
MTSELLEIHIGAWDCMNRAIDDSSSPFRYMSLSTVSEGGRPQSRLPVLRNVDRHQLRLEFHTDTRSPK